VREQSREVRRQLDEHERWRHSGCVIDALTPSSPAFSEPNYKCTFYDFEGNIVQNFDSRDPASLTDQRYAP
jgi:hypothetical protein